MSEITLPEARSPFDALRREDERGEWWSARDLMSPLGYSRWANFADPIERARISLTVNGQDADAHVEVLPGARKNSRGGPAGDDYRLTREGAYAVVQNCDIRKEAVAAAHGYFRARTMEAERNTIGGVEITDPALLSIVSMTAQMQATRNELARQGKQIVEVVDGMLVVKADVAAVKADVADLKQVSPLADSTGLLSLRDLAHACGTGRTRMAEWLRAGGILFDDQQGGGLRARQHPWVENGWAVDRYERWPNGRGWSWVTYFTPAGVAEIRRRWAASGE